MKPIRLHTWVPLLWLVVLSGSAAMATGPLEEEALRNWRRRRPVVARIDILGNYGLAEGTIRDAMQIRTPGLWQRIGLKDRPRLLVGAEDRDEAALRLAYRREGFWDAQAAISAVPDARTDGALITVLIEEGTRYRWGEVSLAGNHEQLEQRCRRWLRELKRGEAADSLALSLAITRIRAECADRGHPDARLRLRVARRLDSLDVDLDLDVGREVVLGEIAVEGATRTKESYILRQLKWRPGSSYSQTRLTQQQQDVYATGLFTFIYLEPTALATAEGAGPRTADFRLRVVERKPSFIGLRSGAGQDPDLDLTWDYAFEWGSRNWLGTGRKWALTAQSRFGVVTKWRVLNHRFAVSYTEPLIFDLRLPTTLTLAYEPSIRSVTQPYHVERYQGELNVTRRVRRISRLWSSLVYERVEIDRVDEKFKDALADETGTNIKARWSLVWERDSRPSVFIPTSGSRTRVDLEYVGEIRRDVRDFYKVDLSWARYQSVGPPTVLATRVRIAWAKQFSAGEGVPTIDRLYMGGANTIRGYSENTVGPVDSTGTPQGGQVLLLASVELRAPVAWKFWFSIFGDLGNNWATFHDVALGDLLLSLGVGWHYMAPVGPIRLDYARRAAHPGYPASDRLHLSILFAF